MSIFDIYPAIDIKDGKCVRLLQGNFDKETVYSKDPLEQMSFFVNKGCKWIHIVDLNAALSKKNNKSIILKIIKIFHKVINIQLGGGIRSVEDIKFWIDKGVKRVVVSTLAYDNPFSINSLEKYYYKKIALGIDVRDNKIAINGWKKELKDINPLDLINGINPSILDVIIYTDISKDGTLNGANILDTINFANLINFPVIVSGGVSTIEEIKKIKQNKKRGLIGVIVGKALYENKVSLKEILKEIYN